MVIEEGAALRDQAALFAESIGAPLEVNVQATEAVTEAVKEQTEVVREGREVNEDLLQRILRAIQDQNLVEALR